MDGVEENVDPGAARGFVDPFEDTAPQPIVGHAHQAPEHQHEAHPHHHEGAPGPAVSPEGHHAAAAAPAVDGRHQDGSRRRTVLVTAAVVAVLAAVAAVGWAFAGRGSSTAAQPTSSASPTQGALGAGPSGSATDGSSATPAMLPASQPTLVLGDSLGLVVYPYLADLVPDRAVTYESEVGRSTAGTANAVEELDSVPPVVIVSSGTNDGTVDELTTGATRILDALGAQRCVVWVDVVRPERIGDTQEEMNGALDAVVAGRANVTVLRWSTLVAQHPEYLAGDGIHPTEEGAKARAQAYADATAACSPIDPAAPTAPKQYLPDSVFWGPVSGSGNQGSGSGQGSGSTQGTSTRSASPSRTASSAPSTSASPSPTRTTTPTPPPSTTAPAPETTAPAEQPPASAAPTTTG